MKLELRQRLLVTTLLVGAGMVATPAFAQDAAPAAPTCPPGVAPGTNGCNPPEPVATTAPQSNVPQLGENDQGGRPTSPQEIIVTGTRIPQPNLETASPVTTVTSQEVQVSGTSRTEDLINSLPQVFASQGSNVSNGATGTAEIDLRGLGPKRNLVLVNGRRLQAGDPRDPVADINFIPHQLIKRVDVLTGGAAAVYGADAVAGVTNFILDNTFTGLKIDGQASVFNHSQHMNDHLVSANTTVNELFFGYDNLYPKGMSTNGGAQDLSGVFGAAFDDGRGHVQAYATYRKQDPVLESTRDFSFCAIGSFAPQYVADYGEYYCGGSSTSPAGRFIALNPITGGNYHVAGNELVPGFPLFNYAPYNYFQRPDERYTAGAFGDYEISPGAKPYVELMFMDDHSDAQIAPSGSFGQAFDINCDNPLMSAQEASIICPAGGTFVDSSGVERGSILLLRRNVEGGGRDDDLEHTDYRLVAGMRGDPMRGISYDAYYQYGKSMLAETYLNDFSVRNLGNALDVIIDPTTGLPACRVAVQGTDTACVPYNVFQTGGVDPAALNYLQTPGFERGYIAETVAHADLTLSGAEYGLQTPWSDSGIGLNLGAEYRKEALDFKVDQEFQSGDLAGQGGPTPPVKGQFDVRDLFGEIQIPIIEHSFIEELTLDAGYRYSNYHVAGNSFNTDTYKLEARFAPVRDIRFRASYNRAVRAPNIVELFAPVAVGLTGNFDPCAGANPTATLQQCEATGLPASQYGAVNPGPSPAKQYQGQFGGNTSLAPETADTWTAGVVVQPRWVPGLALTADWFNIKVKGVISTYGFANVMNTCINTGQLCNLIHRDALGSLWLPSNGTTGFIDLKNANIGGLHTQGFDFQGSYHRRLGGFGTMDISFVGTYLKNLSVKPFNTVYDCAGFYGSTCGSPNPTWRHKLRVSMTTPSGLGASVSWRHTSGVLNDSFSNDPDLSCTDMTSQCTAPGDAKLNSRDYFDLALTARLAQRLNLRMGVNNIFDVDPPISSLNSNGNTFPQAYDSLGRYLFAGFSIDF